MDGACDVHGTEEKFIQELIGKPKGKRLFGKPTGR
jgi:hypothetical protein